MRDWAPIVVTLVSMVAAVYAARASTRATRVNEDGNRIKWLQEAKDEARLAKSEAERATEEAAEVRRELATTKRKAVELGDLLEEYTRWALRVIDWSCDDSMPHAELRRLINGGPPSLRAMTKKAPPPP